MSEIIKETIFIIGMVAMIYTTIMSVTFLVLIVKDKFDDRCIESLKEDITKALKFYCNDRNIEVRINYDDFKNDDKEHAAGYINMVHNTQSGRVERATIHLRDDEYLFIDTRWSILAHEIGHFISQDIYYDLSEEGADREAYNLITEIISERDKIVFNSLLNIYFRDKCDEHHKEKAIDYQYICGIIDHKESIERTKEYYERIRNSNNRRHASNR